MAKENREKETKLPSAARGSRKIEGRCIRVDSRGGHLCSGRIEGDGRHQPFGQVPFGAYQMTGAVWNRQRDKKMSHRQSCGGFAISGGLDGEDRAHVF